MLGSFPPLRALSSYCFELALAVAEITKVRFISFKKIYPSALYPGKGLKDDHTFPSVSHSGLKIKRRLTWYNPVSWIIEGLFTKADILHAQWWSLPLTLVYLIVCGLFRLRGKPVVFTVHNVLSHEKSGLYEKASSVLFKLGNFFIVHTEKNRNQMIDHFKISSGKIALIPHGTLDFHVNKDVDREKIRSQMGFVPDDKVILLFGAIRPYKGIDTVFKSFAKIITQIPEAKLLVVGKLWESWDPYCELMGKLGIQNKVTVFLDYIPSGDVYRYFTASDLVLLPYHHFDSQSGVGATAISFRKPIIVTDVGGLSDLVGDERFIVQPKDHVALAEATVLCLNDPLIMESMIQNTETAAAKLSWSSIAKKTMQVYKHALNQSS